MTRQHLWTDKINFKTTRGNSSQTSITNCIKSSYKTKNITKNNMDTIYEHFIPISWSRQPGYKQTTRISKRQEDMEAEN